MSQGPGVVTKARWGLAWTQGILRLVSAGAVLFEAHTLFLRYYAREWQGIQLRGVNDCHLEDSIANGDLFIGQTFCNKPENFVPWIEVYRLHPVAAAVYYGIAALVIIAIGIAISAAHRRLAGTKPFGDGGKVRPPSEHEHLR